MRASCIQDPLFVGVLLVGRAESMYVVDHGLGQSTIFAMGEDKDLKSHLRFLMLQT